MDFIQEYDVVYAYINGRENINCAGNDTHIDNATSKLTILVLTLH